MVQCKVDFSPCNATYRLHCENGGVCCLENRSPTRPSCECKEPWIGATCSVSQGAQIEFLKAKLDTINDNMLRLSTATIIGLTVAALALIALAILIVLFVRKGQRRRVWRLQQQESINKLNRSISAVQEEIGKLPNAAKLNNLSRLTKLVEVSCLTGGAIVLKGPQPGSNLRPLSPAANACLPSWSSAPNLLESCRAEDRTDGDTITAEKRQKLKHLFSLQDETN